MSKVKLSPSQQNVVDQFPAFLLSEDTEMVISGFAGSGKSFLVKYLADIGERQCKLVTVVDPDIPMRKMHFTATTNKAARVLAGMLGCEAKTIHSLLGLKVMNNYKTGAVSLKQSGEVENVAHSLIFIDEASMINRQLLTVIRTTAKKYTDCKLIFIGDSYQLPPVMEDICPVFKSVKHNFFLSEIQRQVKDSPIIKMSAEYREALDDHELDWPTIPHDGHTIIHYTDKHRFFDAIQTAYTKKYAENDLRVMAWSNRRVREYNDWIRRLQGRIAPYEIGELITTNKPLFSGRNIVAPTDSTAYIKSVTPTQRELDLGNNLLDIVKGYDISLERHGNALFFVPEDWDLANKLAKIRRKEKNWTEFFEIQERWCDFRATHASTVHKAQGSTYREVFVDLNNIGTNTRWREVARLVYVAITRASEKVHVFGGLSMNYEKKPLKDILEAFKNVDFI